MEGGSAMPTYWATYEVLGPGRAIVALFLGGEWSGAGLVELRSPDPEALYEASYAAASARAAAKGGVLGRFSEA